MTWGKRILIFTALFCAFLLVGVLLPPKIAALRDFISKSVSNVQDTVTAPNPVVSDTLTSDEPTSNGKNNGRMTAGGKNYAQSPLQPLLQKLDHNFPLIGIQARRNAPSQIHILVPQGFPLETYALNFSRFFSEVFPNGQFRGRVTQQPLTPLYIRATNGNDRLDIQLGYSNLFHPYAYDLAVGFYIKDDLTEKEMSALRQQKNLCKTLLIDWRKLNDAAKAYIGTENTDELWLWLPMEPHQYPYLNPGAGAIYIHHSADEMEDSVSKILKQFPRARGFVSYMGDRIVENEQVLEKVFTVLAKKNMAFYDLTGSQRSLAVRLGRKMNIDVYKGNEPTRPQNVPIEWESQLLRAKKMGSSMWMLPFSDTLLHDVSSLADSVKMSQMGIQCVPYTKSGKKEIVWPN